MKIKSIDTEYAGYKFRSRLEARWAVFFDCVGIRWEYEKEGYEFDDGTKYLPDFWLPDVEMWAEVKPKNLTPAEFWKAKLLAKHTGYDVIALIGIPSLRPYDVIDGGGIGYDVVLSNYHNYIIDERRFFFNPGFDDPNDYIEMFGDTLEGCNAAKSARFEFGEKYGDKKRS